jgi:hypothetical protein
MVDFYGGGRAKYDLPHKNQPCYNTNLQNLMKIWEQFCRNCNPPLGMLGSILG